MKAALLLCLVFAAPLAAQKDFLTADEIDQLRIVQEPNARLALYARFAKERAELVRNLVARKKAGRSIEIHDTLERYGKIIDAIDTVADDALKHKADIKQGLAAVTAAEKEILPILRQIDENPPQDYGRYQFALKQAIETTQDSIALSEEDLQKRGSEVAAREEKARKELEGMMQTKDLEEKKAAEKKAAGAEGKKRKAPTLKRKGEQ